MTPVARSQATLLSPRQQAAQAAQQRYRNHVTKVCKVPAGIRCWTCDHLDAKAAGLWIRAAGREQVAM